MVFHLRTDSCIVLLASITVCAIQSSSLRGQATKTAIKLVDASESSGLEFVHEDGSSGKEYLVEFMGAGVALFDYDNDGWIDVYFLNGAALPGVSLRETPVNALYRNNHNGTFTDVTQLAGVGDAGYGLGMAIGDYDNDGFKDVYVTNFGPNVLFHNNGDGTFTDVTEKAGVADGFKFGAGAAFLDIDGDGYLDLYSASYVEFSYELHAKLAPSAYPYPPVPAEFTPARDTLFRNGADGTFTDISVESGIASVAGPSMGMVCGDFDHDQDTDIYVACDGAPSHFFVNDARGKFTESGLLLGAAYNALGEANGMMGPDAGDIDNDGNEDIFVTNYSGQTPALFRNLGQLGFEDISLASRAGRDVMPHTNWGAGLVDFDNDGDRDIFISNGHMLKRVNTIEQFTDFRVRNCLMANNGEGRFANVTAQAGSGLNIIESSRGTGFDDLDNDGDIDCVILNCCGAANYLENQTRNDNHWLELELRGTRMNRNAIGARVRVIAGQLVQVAEVRSGRGYQSHYGSRLHFGLGAHDRIDRVEVHWMVTDAQVFEDVPIDRKVVLQQR